MASIALKAIWKKIFLQFGAVLGDFFLGLWGAGGVLREQRFFFDIYCPHFSKPQIFKGGFVPEKRVVHSGQPV